MTGVRFRAKELIGFCSTVYKALGMELGDVHL